MRDEMFEVNIGNLNAGSVVDQIEHAIEKVVANIRDPNTNPEQERTLTLKLKWKPSRERDYAKVKATVDTKLAGLEPSEGSIHISGINGQVRAYIRDIAQDELFNKEQEAANQGKKPS